MLHYKVTSYLCLSAMLATSGWVASANAQSSDSDPASVKKTVEPVFRVSKLAQESDAETPANDVAREEEGPATRVARNPESTTNKELPGDTVKPAATPHPLDRAISFARESLQGMRSDVYDYTATLCKRERVNGVVGDPCYMKIKVRCPRVDANGIERPFSIYMKFLKPYDTAGREVIWVEGQNDGKLMVHEGRGLLSLKTFHLNPDSGLAMQGQRYPIYEAGVENLIVKLIEKAARDKQAGPCEVKYRDGIKINKRPCSLIELVHEHPRPEYEFHKARVFVDEELNLPCRYAAYDWPTSPGGKPSLIEEYTYFNIETNVGLTDQDFDPANPAYAYPGSK